MADDVKVTDFSAEEKVSFSPDDFTADDFEEEVEETFDESTSDDDYTEEGTEEEYEEEVDEEEEYEDWAEDEYEDDQAGVATHETMQVMTQEEHKKSHRFGKKTVEQPKEVVAKMTRDSVATDAIDEVRNGHAVQTRVVDPSASTSRRRRDDKKAQAKKQKEAKAGGIKKKVIIGGACLVLIALVSIIKALGGGGSNKNFLTLTNGILNADLGTFVYEFDVVTSEHTTASQTSEVTMEDLSTLEATDDSSTVAAPKNTFVEWTNSEGAVMTSWEYPNYKIIIEGNCPSVEPFTCDYKISLATAYHEGVLTEVIVSNGNTYVDIDSLGNWLRASKDTYLSRLGEQVPVGAKWLLIPSGEFAVDSRFAEDAELTLSNCTSVQNMSERNMLLLNSVLTTLTSVLTDEDFGTTQSAYTINISDETGLAMVNKAKNMVTNWASCWSSFVNEGFSTGLFTEEQAKQAMREEDNVMKALTELLIYMNYADADSFNPQLVGSAREYTDSFGNQAIESSFVTSFQTAEKDYTVSAKLTRLGKKVDIAEPEGGSITKDQLNDPNIIKNTMYGVIDYLNPTSVKLSVQSELNPERIQETIKQSLIDLVNATESTEMHLTMLTVDDYIQKYATLDPSAASTVDLINAQIVQDYLAVLDGITENIVYASEVEEEVVEVPQYPELVYEDPNIKITAKVDEETSDAGLICLNMFILNKTSSEVTLDLTNFTMQTLLSSIYPANNLTLLKNYDNSWDESLTPEALVMGENDYADIDLYFVISNDKGYMDLWFGESKLGEIVAY